MSLLIGVPCHDVILETAQMHGAVRTARTVVGLGVLVYGLHMVAKLSALRSAEVALWTAESRLLPVAVLHVALQRARLARREGALVAEEGLLLVVKLLVLWPLRQLLRAMAGFDVAPEVCGALRSVLAVWAVVTLLQPVDFTDVSPHYSKLVGAEAAVGAPVEAFVLVLVFDVVLESYGEVEGQSTVLAVIELLVCRPRFTVRIS